jgi:hypothetical protein
MRNIGTSALAGLVLAASMAPALASTITYTISGSVIDGYDASGLFGGGSLKGDAFTAVEVFDPSGAQSSWSNAGGSGANGGSSTNGLSFATVTLTLGGKTTYFSDYTSNVSTTAGVQFNSTVQSSNGPGKNDIGFNIASSGVKADYTQPVSIVGLTDSYAGYYTLNNASGAQVVWANFEVNSLSAGSGAVNAVPLPSAAPLFGAGLLALAAVGYGRRRSSGRPSSSTALYADVRVRRVD